MLTFDILENKETKLRIHNITAKAALKFESEAWVLKKREEQRLEATKMKFLRHLTGNKKIGLKKRINIQYWGKNGSTEHSKGNKTVPEKSGYNTYRGWTQIEYQNKHYNIDQKDEGTEDDRRREGGNNFILRIKEQEKRLNIHEHDDDDDDEKIRKGVKLKKISRRMNSRKMHNKKWKNQTKEETINKNHNSKTAKQQTFT